MIDIAFDQYQRYKTTEIIINNYKKYYQLENIKILEVGANEHKNLEKFLYEDDVYYLDIFIPKHLKNDHKYILGDATNLVNINDNEFDITIALDVYEHIPSNKREQFLKEIDRVSKYGVIICAPFNYNHVEEAEIRANEYFKVINGDDFIWLKEHIDEKLPCIDSTYKIIDKLEKKFVSFGHGDIYLWEKLIKCHFYVSRFEEGLKYRTLIDKLYNTELYISDRGDKNYRDFIIYSSDNNSLEFIKDELDKYFSKKINVESRNLIDQLIMELTDISNIKRLNKINENIQIKNKIYEMVYYIKEKNQEHYTEDKSIKKVIRSSKITHKIDLSNYNLDNIIRIDPINSNCIISKPIIYTIKYKNRVDLEIIGTNADVEYDEKYFFRTEDPQMYVNLNDINIESIYVEFTLIDYDSTSMDATINLIEKFKLDKESTINKLKNELRKDIDIQIKSITRKNEEISRKEINIKKLEREISLLKKEINNKTLNIENLEKSMQELINEILKIKSRRIWKVVTKINEYMEILKIKKCK